MEVWIIASILFGSLLLFILLGVPVAFTMGGLSLIIGFIFWGGYASVEAFVLGSYGKVLEFVLTAVPLYILMAAILRYSDLADDMYEAIYRWLGGIKGGLAAGTTIIAAIFGAMVGIATVATATLGVTARTSMLKRGYDTRLVSGVILAGGSLGILIPPSILMVIYAAESGVSAGRLFFAGVVPGAIAAILFMGYAIVKCYMNPALGPSLKKEERYSFREKLSSLKGVTLPLLVIIIVLGTIYLGIATPTEAAAVGVIGSLISAAIKRKLVWANIKNMLIMTVKLNGMVFWLVIGAVAYARIVAVTGVGAWLAGLITDMEVNRWIILIGMQVIFFILGMFIDPAGILLMTAPLFLPVVTSLGFDPIWYGVIFVMNMCIAYMSPPFGFNLFVLRGVAPDLKMNDLYMSVIPFIILYMIAMFLVIIFPQLALWLPDLMMN
ncbi:hypothetical protein BTR23_13200 [Alkalihalophilus pseudofirmus]|nr:hypothetical protein BTR23_13200 [Alkalihalophilus pseudofirmus]